MDANFFATIAVISILVALLLVGLRLRGFLVAVRRLRAELKKQTTDSLFGMLRGDPPPPEPWDLTTSLCLQAILLELQSRGDSRVIPLLIDALTYPDVQVRRVANDGLRDLTGERFRKAGKDLEPDPDAYKRWFTERKERLSWNPVEGRFESAA